ncbi:MULTISPECIES: excinuclease ABC subunit UvrA [Acetobacter]|uniref:UvrABC system protein A n=1 Tax=Acetobacter pomorum DM001 TaxID=945681 RepID=F1YVW0_9PROT|nr:MULTISPECIES: excinuclease ABC subunit UvrA [Acetobacter]ATI13241.1 excinuclease ABC subunit UvrA [Acetobacter pomorum]AXC26643.1 excinuclease ABC subunit UvrA [Acetobacter sp. JWB]EGE46953.1 UvrABC system protein A [Acetobacter pomorum DM001]KAA8426170.1 excinuclease ABC subunit UvrA [Acetobacter pomorum]KAA8431473.1 excinuclease ABC subunit UvrA [Acetobacter pomorum]
MKTQSSASSPADMICVRGAREHNLKNVSVSVPRDKFVVMTGVSGSGKSSLAFGTIYAEAQRRYLESVSPYARRLFNQMPVPVVDTIEGLPPAVALQQQRGGSSSRSSVGSLTTLSNLLRMLYSRAGTYPAGMSRLEAEDFSSNTPMGACPRCHGLGRIYDVTDKTLVPDDTLSIRQRAVAAWPTAWQGQNLRDILITRGVNVDIPWKDLPKATRDWILYTKETPTEPVYPGRTHAQVLEAIKHGVPADYNGTFTGARQYVLNTFTKSQSAKMRARAASFMVSSVCPECHGQKLKVEALQVLFAGRNIAELSSLPLKKITAILREQSQQLKKQTDATGLAAYGIVEALIERLQTLLELGLGYLQLSRGVQTLSPGEYQRLRLGTQIRSNLFGVLYVLDEPSSGLHPCDTQALLKALHGLLDAGNSLLVVEHNCQVIRHAEWLVDVGPDAGEKGGEILYSGSLEGLRSVSRSRTRPYIFNEIKHGQMVPLKPEGWLCLKSINWNNLHNVTLELPLGVMTVVTGISGSGKSSLAGQALVSIVSKALGQKEPVEQPEAGENDIPEVAESAEPEGQVVSGLQNIRRLVVVDQKPIGRTPRSNLATYTGLFDQIRQTFAVVPQAKQQKMDAGWFSFNVAKGRCSRCEGVGSIEVELLFLPSVYAPCPECHGARYKPEVLAITLKGRNIADVLNMSVDEAHEFFADSPNIAHGFDTLRQGGLGYLRLGQPATTLSGGEAQRIKLATELQKKRAGHMLYVLDEPTTGLHPADVDRLIRQLRQLVAQGHTVVLAEHDMRLAAQSDWMLDMGPGAGDEGGQIVARGTPADIAKNPESRTGPFLREYL